MKAKPDKLAQDVSKAIAAGMSYGKWKAMQTPEVKKEKTIPLGWGICQWCGEPYMAKTKRPQLYCGAECQRAAQYEKDKERKAKRAAYIRERRAQGKA